MSTSPTAAANGPPIDPKDDKILALICAGACIVVWLWAFLACNVDKLERLAN